MDKENTINFLLELTKLCRKNGINSPYYKVYNGGNDSYIIDITYHPDENSGWAILPHHCPDEEMMRFYIESIVD